MYISRARAYLMKRRAIYENKLLELNAKKEEYEEKEYEHLVAVYELIIREFILIEKNI